MEVHADDTDIAIMLVHHWEDKLHDIVFCATQSKKSWSIKDSATDMTPDVKAVLPFIHSFSGCNTTSALFGIGKATVLKKFKGKYSEILLGKRVNIHAVAVLLEMPEQ